jgi:hypothetical protein
MELLSFSVCIAQLFVQDLFSVAFTGATDIADKSRYGVVQIYQSAICTALVHDGLFNQL